MVIYDKAKQKLESVRTKVFVIKQSNLSDDLKILQIKELINPIKEHYKETRQRIISTRLRKRYTLKYNKLISDSERILKRLEG